MKPQTFPSQGLGYPCQKRWLQLGLVWTKGPTYYLHFVWVTRANLAVWPTVKWSRIRGSIWLASPSATFQVVRPKMRLWPRPWPCLNPKALLVFTHWSFFSARSCRRLAELYYILYTQMTHRRSSQIRTPSLHPAVSSGHRGLLIFLMRILCFSVGFFCCDCGFRVSDLVGIAQIMRAINRGNGLGSRLIS